MASGSYFCRFYQDNSKIRLEGYWFHIIPPAQNISRKGPISTPGPGLGLKRLDVIFQPAVATSLETAGLTLQNGARMT
jgi:hypothetical protein